MLITVAMITPIHIAAFISIHAKRHKEGGAHTSEDSTRLLGIEAMVSLEDEWNRAELKIKNSPAERGPEGKEEDDRLSEKHICIMLDRVSENYRTMNIRKGR